MSEEALQKELTELKKKYEVLQQLAIEHHRVRDELRDREILAERDRDTARAETQELAQKLHAVTTERDELHRQAKAVVDFVVDECGFRLVEFMGIDGPVRAVRKLKEQRDEFALNLDLEGLELKEKARVLEAIQRDAQVVHEQRNAAQAELAAIRRRPPMACTSCEEHNEQLVEIIQLLQPLADVLDDEFCRRVAGYETPLKRIHDATLAFRRDIERLSTGARVLLGRIKSYNSPEIGSLAEELFIAWSQAHLDRKIVTNTEIYWEEIEPIIKEIWGKVADRAQQICQAECAQVVEAEQLAMQSRVTQVFGVGVDLGAKDEGKVVTYRVDAAGKPQILDIRSAEPGEHCGGASCSVDAGGGCICACEKCVRKDVAAALSTLTDEVKVQLEDDLRVFGNAFIRRNSNGTAERIDPTRTILSYQVDDASVPATQQLCACMNPDCPKVHVDKESHGNQG